MKVATARHAARGSGRFALSPTQRLLGAMLLGLAMTGCASKNKDQLSIDGANGRGGVRSLESVVAGNQDVASSLGSDDLHAEFAQAGRGGSDEFGRGVVGSDGSGSTGTRKGKRPPLGLGSADDPVGDWERELLPDAAFDYSSPSLLADRVLAAREHARNIALEDENTSLYAAVTGGRDLYDDVATGLAFEGLGEGAESKRAWERRNRNRALADGSQGRGAPGSGANQGVAGGRAGGGNDYASNPGRDYERNGFFDEEAYAFDGSMSEAERSAARVEAARRFAGLDDATSDHIAALGSRPDGVYVRDDYESSGSLVAGNGRDSARGNRGAQSADTSLGGRGGKRGRNDALDVAMNDSTVTEDVVPQTLGGTLPMILGVDEDGFFDFDAHTLRDEVKVRLDGLVRQLADADFDQLDVAGYTDHIGTAEYNKELSRRRAFAVARYLRDQGVPEEKLRVRGMGQADRLSVAEVCDVLRGEEKIKCLQPDRRVEISASIRRLSVGMK